MSGHITIGTTVPVGSVTQPIADPTVSSSPVEPSALADLAVAAESAVAEPVVDDSFIPFTETVFESLDESAEVREEATSEAVAEEFGGRLAQVFRGLQEVRKMLAEGNFLGAAQRLARLATVSRRDTTSLSRFREARVLLHYTESAQRALATGDVDDAVLKLEEGMGEVAAGAQDSMSKSSARRLVRGLAKVRAAANEGDYDTAISQTRQMIGRYGDAELDQAFERVIQTLETIDELRDLRVAGFSGRWVSTSRFSFTRIMDGLRGASRFTTEEASAAEPREIDETRAVEFAVPDPHARR